MNERLRVVAVTASLAFAAACGSPGTELSNIQP